MKSPSELTELFRSQGLKVTPQRQCIFRALHGSQEHPTAESVYATVSAEMPTISLRTVYQTLKDLASMGEIAQIDLGTGSARFDPTLEVHHHLVCDSCGTVRDVYVDFSDVQVPVGHDHGYRVSSTEIVFRGLCPTCADSTQRLTTNNPAHVAEANIAKTNTAKTNTAKTNTAKTNTGGLSVHA